VPGLILRAGGAAERLGSTGTVLGLFENWDGGLSSTQLEPGDRLVLYTDGVTECEDDCGEDFSQQRLIDAIRGNDALPSVELAAAVSKEVLAFSQGRQFDDLTLIVARREA